MKAAQVSEYHQDFAINEVPDPKIELPTDVIVRVGAAGFCRTDIHIWDGQFDELFKAQGIELPYTCGHENAGWVEEVGPGVTNVKVGDAVLCHPLATCGYCHACRAGDDMHCTGGFFPGVAAAPGGMAQYLRSNARACVPLPENLTPVDVAPQADAGLTAYRAVKKAIPLAVPGSRIVVQGAGGLGHIGIQALRAMSAAEIIVVDRSEKALEHARGWGADHTVLAKDDHSHVDEVRELTKGEGAQAVIDYVGEGGAEHDAVGLLAANGTHFMVGYGGTLQVKILEQALFPETSFVGCIVGNYNELRELVDLQAKGYVKLTTTTFPLDGVNEAFHALDEGRMIGRGVLVPNES